MGKLMRPGIRAAVSFSLLFSATSAQAALISDNLVFETQDQSMWSQGTGSSITIEQFLGTRWGTYREPYDDPFLNFLGITPPANHYDIGGFVGGEYKNVCIGIDTSLGCGGYVADSIDTTTGAEVDIYTSGQVGVYVGAELRSGGIDIKLPVSATVELPEQVTAGEFFTVATAGSTLAAGSSITADAPSFRAFVDGVFDTENRFVGEACVLGECAGGEASFNVNLGRFNVLEVDSGKEDPWSIFGLDLTGVPIAKVTKRAPSATDPDGIDELGPPDPNPLKPPILLQVEVPGLEQQSGGQLAGDALGLTTNQDLVDVNISLTGIAETFLKPPGAAALLKNKYTLLDIGSPFPKVDLTYTIANIEVGPVLGLQQQFNLNPSPAVRLAFDKPVTRIEQVQVGTRPVVVGERCVSTLFGICVDYEDVIEMQPIYAMQPVTHDDGLIEILLGDTTQLAFNDGIGQLLDRTYFLADSIFSNKTSLTVALEATAEFGCLSVPGVGSGCVIEESIRTDPGSLFSNNRSFTMGGFNEVNFQETIMFLQPGGGPGGEPGPGPGDGSIALSEPESLYMLLIGFLGLALAMVVSQRSQYQLTRSPLGA